MSDYKFFLTCPGGFENLLIKELETLSISELKESRGGVYFNASFEDGMNVCLWTRLGGRLLLQLKSFEVEEEKDIYNAVSGTEWDMWFSPDKTISIDTTAVASQFRNSSYLSLIVKDGIADYFREKTGERPSVGKDHPDIRINLFIDKNEAVLSLDMSGNSLHQRGYRIERTEATLKENVAAGLLLRSGWGEMSLKSSAFLDPMCGSGTFLIEAALIAANIAPSVKREYFCFKNYKNFDNEVWNNLKKTAESASSMDALSKCRITGFDINMKAVKASRANIENLTLSRFISVKQGDILKLDENYRNRGVKGLIAFNPPYGERLGEIEALKNLYRETGELLKKSFNGWKVNIITGNEELSRKIALKPLRVNTVYNGPIKCSTSVYELDNSYREDKKGERDNTKGAVVFENRLRKNLKNIRKWAKKEGVSSYRIYDADIPEYSAAVDYYESEYIYLQEYQPPKEIPAGKAEKRLMDMVKKISSVLEIERDKIFIRQRKRQKSSSQYMKLSDSGEFEIMNEGGLSFYVNYHDYLDTGIFLDHRKIRGMIRDMAKDKSFLNLFAYTSTASVYAAAGGAKKAVSVDTSAAYLEWGINNFRLNKLPLEKTFFRKQDSMDYLRQGNEIFDLIFIDPPTFSNSKSRDNDFDIQRDHAEMLYLAGKRLQNKGIIIFSNNYKKFKLDQALENDFLIEDITESTISADFSRNKKIHRCWILKKR